MIDEFQFLLKSAAERGRQEGFLEGLRHALLHHMSHRIGEVPSDIVKKLDELAEPELYHLGDALFDLTTYADVEGWLTQH